MTIKSLAFAILTSALALNSPQLTAAEDPRAQFFGDYELVTFYSYPENGEPILRNYVGRISYSEFGNMEALGMLRDYPERAAETGENGNGGFAYWGPFTVYPEQGMVIHHVIGSPTSPNMVGGDNVRYYEFEDDLLRLSIRNAEGRVTGTLTWRRLD